MYKEEKDNYVKFIYLDTLKKYFWWKFMQLWYAPVTFSLLWPFPWLPTAKGKDQGIPLQLAILIRINTICQLIVHHSDYDRTSLNRTLFYLSKSSNVRKGSNDIRLNTNRRPCLTIPPLGCLKQYFRMSGIIFLWK